MMIHPKPLLSSIGALACALYSLQIAAQTVEVARFVGDQYTGQLAGIEYAGKLYFAASTVAYGRELWCSDGTVAGTAMVADIYPGTGGSITNYFETKAHVVNGILYFLADDGVHGHELWRTDGTEAGTYLVLDQTPGITGSTFGDPVHIGNTLYYLGGTGNTLCRSDGTAQGTTAIQGFQIARDLTPFNGHLYFSASVDNSGEELWKCNGNTNVCSQLADLNGAFGASLPCNFHATPSAVYFMAVTGSGWELWRTTGSAASTQMVKDINPGGANGTLSYYSETTIASVGDTVFFRATDGATGFQLWKSDGTEAGTVRVSDLPDAVLPELGFPIVNGKVLFSSYSQSRFWGYDTNTGTTAITHYPARYYFSGNDRYAVVNNVLVHINKDSVYGCEVWRADGTQDGNRPVQETDLTDNWSSINNQGYNKVIGKAGSHVLFTVARTHIDSQIPLFAYNVDEATTCFAPSILVPVHLTDTTAHVVWNGIPEAEFYELRIGNNGNWTSLTTNRAYAQLPVLLSNSSYEVQLRSSCGGSFSEWSDTLTFTSSTLAPHSYVHAVAEKSESPTIERIYWLRTTYIQNVQFRYRPFGSATWAMTTNNTGCKRLQNLNPTTLYEYQYRIDAGAGWEDWPTYIRYFITGADVAVCTSERELVKTVVYPNPATSRVSIQFENQLHEQMQLVDLSGQVVGSYRVDGNRLNIDLSPFAPATYLLLGSLSSIEVRILKAGY